MVQVRFRDLTPADDHDIDLVAQRMRATLVEVEGRAGEALYDMDWLRARVRWHLETPGLRARVIVVEREGLVVGHTIVREEQDALGQPYGLISTTYIVPEARRQGLARWLLRLGEEWFLGLQLRQFQTCTSATNHKLIALYQQHGYAIVDRQTHETTQTEMVLLQKRLPPP